MFSLKKVFKIFLKSLLALIMLVLVLWILLQTNFFQNFIIHRVAKSLSKNLHTTVSIKHVDAELFDKLLLEGTLVLDKNKDTLLYAGTVRVSITDWFFLKDQTTLKYIGLDDAVINLKRSDSTWNYQFLADYFSGPSQKADTTKNAINLGLEVVSLNRVKIWQQDEWRGENILVSLDKLDLRADQFDTEKKIIKIGTINIDEPVFSQYDYTGNRPEDTTKKAIDNTPDPSGLEWNTDGWHILVKNIILKNGALAIEKEGNSPSLGYQFDENHIVLSDLNGTLKNCEFIKDTLKAKVDISAKDRGGFIVKKLSADYKFTPKLMEFRNLDIVTAHSHLKNYFAMHYHSFNDDMADFIHAVTMEGNFENSELSSDDLAYFAPDTKSWKTIFSLKGKAKGKVDNITAQKIVIQAGANNYLDGDISLRGLPDIGETFIDFRSRELKTNYNELARLIPSLQNITNPNLSGFGNILFVGSYTGYIRDFVTYGTLSTDMGILQTDLHMKVPSSGPAVYEGKVSTDNFKLGNFINNNQIGNIAFDGKINGKGFNANDINIGIDGTIRSIVFNKYTYTNIIAHGDFDKKLFTGSASIDDPHIKIDTLVGSINFSKTNPEFNLMADVGRLNLKNLGFTNDSLSLTGKFKLDFKGNNIDNFLGSANLYNAILLDNGQHLSFDSLSINSSVSNGKKLLTLQTNELDVSINGNFKILGLPEAFQLFLNKYYPIYIPKPDIKAENQDFTFLIKTKHVSDYMNLFDKRISGFDNSIIIGNINIAKNNLDLKADVPQFNYSNISFNNIHFTGKGTQDTLRLNGDIDDIVINDSLHSPNTKITVVAANDISDITINTTGNKMLSSADIAARIQTKKDGFKLTFYPSTFTINQKQWNIAKNGELELYKDMLIASNIRFSQDQQEVLVSTHPSDISNSNDVLVAVKNLVIEDFTPMFLKTPQVNGLLNGNISIIDPFNRMAIEFNTVIDKFKFETDSVGIIKARGEYLSEPGSFKINTISNNELYNFVANFGFNPKDSLDQLSGSVVFNNSGIHILENYLDNIFSNIHGRATGILSISGKASEPKLTGSVRLDSTSLTIDYTKCRYILNNNSIITFNPDEIDFGTIKIKDTLNHTATLSGKIYHSFFDKFFFNELHFKTDAIGNSPPKFILLNTTARDNNQFYGNVIGRAELSLNGFVTDMHMSISGEPTDSSHIYLPTGETAETGSLDYIEFTKFGREMKVDLKASQNANIKVDMELTANPLVKIDVILDETTGDVIKAQGSGKLNITAGTRDPLTIRGRYDIEQGEYTFNFQTFLKTPFTLQQGYIEWQGDPYLANMNIDAIYRAQNVNLSNIPTSSGFTNTKGDVDIIFKLRGTLKDPRPEFEFEFPFDNPLKSDPIANEYLKTRYQSDNNELNKQVTSLLLFNTFMSSDQGLLTGNNTGNFVTRSVGQLLSATLSSSLNNWLQKLLNTNSVNLYTNINTADFNFQKGVSQKEIQNVGNFGLKTALINHKLLVTVGGNVDYRLGQTVTNSNSNFLFTPDVSFEYLISPDGRFRVIGFNRSDAAVGDIAGVTRQNRTGIQLSYRKDFDNFEEFFTNEKKKKLR
ncbi:MAG: translocation/assembly module TamB domain-containing protein [Bacteroidota bacterium]|nr:translocation/assembly module TamB domain-containing protein [Bacteroidota bacterium]